MNRSALSLSENGPRRRLRDRLVERDGTSNRALSDRYELQNLLLLIDDDLRETALALGSVESFLAEALHLLDSENVTAEALGQLVSDRQRIDQLDGLAENFANLHRRLGIIANTLR